MIPRRAPATLLLAALSGCAGPSASEKRTLNDMLREREFAAAEAHIHRTDYGGMNSILYRLDLAMLLHQAGRYAESSEHFEKAQARMEELYTRSMRRETGAVLANETIREYVGEPFERALCHVFHGLNYRMLGHGEEALVEARRVESFLGELNRREEGRRSYREDALARYIAALLYQEAGKADDARISFDAAERIYRDYVSDYGMRAPDIDRSAPGPDGEIVFVHYNGPAPRKIRHTEAREPKGSAVGRALDTLVGTSYPVYVQDPFAIANARLRAGEASAEAELVEDVFAIASKDLAERTALLRARSSARGALKLAAQALTGVNASESEFADTRSWATLPAQVRMARLRLTPGDYAVEADFIDASGRVLSTRGIERVRVQAGRRAWLVYRTNQ